LKKSERTAIRSAAKEFSALLAIVACLWASLSGKPQTPLNVSGLSDPEVLERIVQRVRHGDNYYEAAGDELRADHFHVRSVFNWRQPLYAWFLAAFPKPIFGQLLLGALAIVMTLLAVRFLLVNSVTPCQGRAVLAPSRSTSRSTSAGPGRSTPQRYGHRYLPALLAGALVPGAAYGAFVGWGATTLEIWAGVLMAISVFAYGADLWLLGLIIALLALFIRELIAPYVLVCIIVAVFNRRYRELIAWTFGLLLYAAYFAFHIVQVRSHIMFTDAPDPIGWLQFGGLHFILTTAAQNVIFLPLPLWTVAVYLPLAVLGLTAIPGDLGRRATFTVAAYFLLFSCFGKSFNDYWGFIYSPLLALGFCYSPVRHRKPDAELA
jgi:hypothetical protein